VIALDTARIGLSFTAGLLAAINPCGFVLLPTYLMYFLGMENLRPGAERGSVPRALKVSLAVSAGFMTIFVALGVAFRMGSQWLVDHADWISLGIGLALVVLGVAMLFGYQLPMTTPKLDVQTTGEGRDRSVRAMYLFGLAYAIASIGCTIGPFIGTVLGGFSASGWATGAISLLLYGLGMATLITGLTVTLALANTALLKVLRHGMTWFETLAGIFVLLTGLYLTWYWYNGLTDRLDDDLVGAAESWQNDLANFVREHQWWIVGVAGVVVIGAVAANQFLTRRPRPPAA
jgi:cytochrome c-type biogenesis protein